MKILAISDLHLDFSNNYNILSTEKYFNDKVDIILICGDTCTYKYKDKDTLNTFFQMNIYSITDMVIEIYGNHCYWGTDFEKNKQIFNHQKKWINNKHLILNNDNYIYKDINFIGSTLWSEMISFEEYDVYKRLNDYKYIKNFGTKDSHILHENSINYIDKALKESNYRNIVLTHHSPSYQMVSDIHSSSNINSAYCSSDEKVIENNNIEYWFHGHLHNQKSINLFNTKVINNSFGYSMYNEHLGFNTKSIKI